MAFFGFLVALALFFYYKRRLESCRRRDDFGPDVRGEALGGKSWQQEWQRHWAQKFQLQAERRLRHLEHHVERRRRRFDRRMIRFGLMLPGPPPPEREADADRVLPLTGDAELLRRARKRAHAEAGFYSHLMTYLGALAFLALINLFTTAYPWFVWPAISWGIGLFTHYMAVFGSRLVKERYFYPAIEREVRREKVVMQTEKQATIDELSATIAHEIRNPIAAAKSLVQQMSEDPTSVENVEYAKVALEELDRVERQVSHLLKYAKEEDYTFDHVDLAAVVASALTQLRAKLDAAQVSVGRNYTGGPTVLADAAKLRQVFANILDNAIDALEPVAGGRRIDVAIENGARRATVRIRDNGAGIPGDTIDRIFNPFFTTKERGTGLGMAISKKIVEAHEGTIDVASEPGGGAEFVVTLPVPH